MLIRERSTSFFLLLSALLLVVGLVWFLLVARPLLNALIVAGILASLLNPAVNYLVRRFHLPRSIVPGLIFVMGLILFLLIVLALAATLWQQAPRLELEWRAALVEMEGWLLEPALFFGIQFDFEPLLIELQEATSNAFSRIPIGSGTILASVNNNLLWTLVVFITLYYFLKDGPKIKPWLIQWLPDPYQSEGRKLLEQVDEIWGVFLRIQLLMLVILTLLMSASTLLIIWTYRLGWLPLSPFGVVILILVVYTAVQQVDNLWLRPQLLGRRLQLHPGIVFVGFITALALSGVLAAIIVVPLLATLKLLGRYTHAKLLGLPVSFLNPESEPIKKESEMTDTPV